MTIGKMEQRKEVRHVPSLQSDGRLILRTANGRVPILGLKDISNYGISILLDAAVAPADRVAIEYMDSSVKLEVYGRVAWCVAAEGGRNMAQQVAGIELLSPVMLAAMMTRPPTGTAMASGRERLAAATG